MRFMMLMIPKGYEFRGARNCPGRESGRGDDEVQQATSGRRRAAGARRAASALNGCTRHLLRGKPTVTDGPFAEAKEVLGGYWMIQAASREEAIEWAKRCPGGDNEVIEVRQVQEMADFPEDVRRAAAGFDALGG